LSNLILYIQTEKIEDMKLKWIIIERVKERIACDNEMLSKDEMEIGMRKKLTQTIQTSEICITKTPIGILVLEQFFKEFLMIGSL